MIAAILVNGFAPVEASAGHGSTTITRTRTYAVGDVGPVLGGVGGMGMVLGCPEGTACFGYTYGDTFTVSVRDDSGRRVGGVIRITNRSGTVLVEPFCGSSVTIPLVDGNLRVYLDAPGDVRGTHWYGGPGCAEIRPVGRTGATTRGATSGRVHLKITRRG